MSSVIRGRLFQVGFMLRLKIDWVGRGCGRRALKIIIIEDCLNRSTGRK